MVQTPLKHLSGDELAALVEQYPWFTEARMEQCRRGAADGVSLYAETAPYAVSLRALYDIAHGRTPSEESPTVQEVIAEAPRKKVRVAGGDFFSQDEYDDVRQDSDALLSAIATAVRGDESVPREDAGAPVPFCTEPLARIYAEQGYMDQAKYIYSQLILRYPEKSAYFAALIDRLDND